MRRSSPAMPAKRLKSLVEFGPDLGPRRALEGGPRLQLGSRPEDAAAEGLLHALKEKGAAPKGRAHFASGVRLKLFEQPVRDRIVRDRFDEAPLLVHRQPCNPLQPRDCTGNRVGDRRIPEPIFDLLGIAILAFLHVLFS
jgi:hypothetical protein